MWVEYRILSGVGSPNCAAELLPKFLKVSQRDFVHQGFARKTLTAPSPDRAPDRLAQEQFQVFVCTCWEVESSQTWLSLTLIP